MKKLWIKIFVKFNFERKKLRFVSWFDKRFPGKYCWADCVSWSYDKFAFNPFKIGGGCKTESETHSTGMCYCGRWNEGKCFDLLSKEEQEQYHKGAEASTIELPF